MKNWLIVRKKDGQLFPENGLDLMAQDLFTEMFRPFSGNGRVWPPITVMDEKDKITVKAELPGMDKKKINIEIRDDVLTISGDKKWEKEGQKGDAGYTEINYGSFSRRIRLRSKVSEKDVTASYRDGILTVILPRSGEDSGKSVEVQ